MPTCGRTQKTQPEQLSMLYWANRMCQIRVMSRAALHKTPAQRTGDGESAYRRDPVHPRERDGWPSI